MGEEQKDMATIKRHVKAIIQFRRDTEAEWIKYNPVLRQGEPALSTDVQRVKVGDGVTDWINLDYIDRPAEDNVDFITTLDGIIGRENRLYINKAEGTAFIWENNEWVELESSSIAELRDEISANESVLADHEERITTNKDNIDLLAIQVAESADKNFIYKQQTASDTWTVVHNLGKYPSITVVDSAGTVVTGEIILQTTEQAVISFNAAFSGKAYCN